MAKTRFIRFLFTFGLVLWLGAQPLAGALPVAVAQNPDASTETLNQEAVSPEDIRPTQAASSVDSLDDLAWLLADEEPVSLSPQDVNKLNEGEVDVRTTDYLVKLVTPVDQGGYGLGPIKAERIYKNYATKGIGRLDREGLDSQEEDNSIISAHHDGRGVDISEIGQVTCKLVKRRHVGGSTTSWQAPQPVKVAWQSRDGINRYPTPSGDSLVGTASSMSAESIVQYLNDSGEMDAYVDYVKGSSFEDIALYVGANIFLKNYVPSQVKSDPLAMSLIEQLGAQALHKKMPGLPAESFTGATNEDVRLRIAKARLEESLGLPPGSLIDYGWNNLMKNTGKRVIERELGLPALYLDTHNLEQMTALETVQASLDYLGRKDDAFNVVNGTIEAIKNKDDRGLLLAGVQALALALKATPEQKEALIKAAIDGTAPPIDSTSFPVTNLISADALAGLLSDNKSLQQEAINELRQTGLTMLQQAAAKAVPNEYSGVTRKVLTDLITKQSLSVSEIALAVGAGQIAAETGLSVDDVTEALRNPRSSRSATTIAGAINEALSLTGDSLLNTNDVQLLLKRGDNTVARKIAGSEIERAMKWNEGTGLAVLNREKPFEEAMKESFANAVAEMLGLPAGSYTFNKDTSRTFAAALLESRLGLPKGTIKIGEDTRPEELLRTIGREKSLEIFGIDITEGGKPIERDSVIAKLKSFDLALNLPPDTIRQYLMGNIKIEGLDKQVLTANFANVTAGKIWDYYGLEARYQLSGEEITNVITVLRDGSGVTIEQQQAALGSIYRLLGRTVDAKTNFALDSFVTYFTQPDKRKATTILLDQGLNLFASSIGINIPGITVESLQQTATQIKGIFNGDPTIENNRKEYAALEAKGNKRSSAENARFNVLFADNNLRLYMVGFNNLTSFFLSATGIPTEFRQDAAAFISGDFKTGLSGMSFVLWQKAVNPYLPTDLGLSYQLLRDTIFFDDEARIQARTNKIIADGGYEVSPQERTTFEKIARRELMEEAKKDTEYKISDGFLRKADPTIPVGFSKVLFSNDDKARAELFQTWAFNHLDALLLGADRSYVPGTLEALYKGSNDDRGRILIGSIANRLGLSLGPINASDMVLYMDYLTTSPANRGSFYTDVKYAGMWTALDGWLNETFGVGELPTGVAKSFYYASQNGWDFNKEIVDGQGQVIVASISNLGESFMLSNVSRWGDKKLGLPAGTVLQTYRAIKTVADASNALKAAHALGDAAKVAQSSKALSAAQASLTVLVITTALNACSVCQQVFSAVDQAIAAPPGFTNAAVAGAIAMAFGLGPAGLYIAAAIYLFGVYKVDYLCPLPPRDPYSLTAYDKDYDQLDYGYPYDPSSGLEVKSSPPPGTNPFDWDNDVQFADGKDPRLWMGWSRYFTGQLLDKTLEYGETAAPVNQPRQVITLRQANVEFFANRAVSSFGIGEIDNPRVGMGYSQDSTKTTDWVHVAFGGLF